MSRRLKPFIMEEHAEFGNVIGEVSQMLDPYVEKLWQAYGVRSKQANQLLRALNIITSQLCNEMDKEWYNIKDNTVSHKKNPYYGSHKVGW